MRLGIKKITSDNMVLKITNSGKCRTKVKFRRKSPVKLNFLYLRHFFSFFIIKKHFLIILSQIFIFKTPVSKILKLFQKIYKDKFVENPCRKNWNMHEYDISNTLLSLTIFLIPSCQ